MDAQAGIHDRHRVARRSHLAGTYRMVGGRDIRADEGFEISVGANEERQALAMLAREEVDQLSAF